MLLCTTGSGGRGLGVETPLSPRQALVSRTTPQPPEFELWSRHSMVTISPEPDARGWENRIRLSATAAVVLAIALGLCGGYLDVLIMIAKKYWWNDLGYIWSGRDFLWSVPLVSAVLLLAPALLLAALNRLWPGGISLRQAAWRARHRGDLGGSAAGTPLRCMHFVSGRRSRAVDQRLGCGLSPPPPAGTPDPGWFTRPVNRAGGGHVRPRGNPRIPRGRHCRRLPRVPAMSCSSSGIPSAPII